MICFFFVVMDHFVTIKFFVRSPYNQITFFSFTISSVTGFRGQKRPTLDGLSKSDDGTVRSRPSNPDHKFKTSLWVVRLNKSSSSPPHPQYSLLNPFILLNCSSLYAVTEKKLFKTKISTMMFYWIQFIYFGHSILSLANDSRPMLYFGTILRGWPRDLAWFYILFTDNPNWLTESKG